MTDEAKLKEQAFIGRQSKAVLDNPRFAAAFEKIEKFLLDSIPETCVDEQMVREDAYRQVRLLRKLRDVFTREVITGDAAAKELLQLKDPPKLMRMLNGRR